MCLRARCGLAGPESGLPEGKAKLGFPLASNDQLAPLGAVIVFLRVTYS